MTFLSKNKNNIISSLLTLSGLPGQIIARAIYKNGSMDKPYLLLFAKFPWSVVPSGAMWSNYITDGEIGKPYDINIVIAIILMFLLPLIIYKFLNSENMLHSQHKNFIGPIIQLVFIGIIYYIYNKKFQNVCPKLKKSPSNIKSDYRYSAFTHALLLAPLALICGKILLSFIKHFIESNDLSSFNIVDINIFSSLLDNSSNVDNNDIIFLYMSTAVSFGIIYVLLNMIYSTKKTQEIGCNRKISRNIIIIGIILNIFIPMFIKPNLLITPI
jgi:hypothetical protein